MSGVIRGAKLHHCAPERLELELPPPGSSALPIELWSVQFFLVFSKCSKSLEFLISNDFHRATLPMLP